MKSVIITGVSTGIGYAAAKALLSGGFRVFGSVRKKEDADRLQSDFGENYKPLFFDVTDEEAVISAANQVGQSLGENETISGLVNNAGIALGGPFLELPTAVFRKQLEVNVLGVVAVTKAFSKLLGCTKQSNTKGKIIMISSVSGKRSYPFVAPYTASKHALEGLSDSLRRELLIYGIDVILIEPGPIKTPIWNKAPAPDNSPFIGSDFETPLNKFYNYFMKKGKTGLSADVIGNLILNIMNNSNPKTRYVVTKEKFNNYFLPGILPDRWLDRMIGKGLGLIRKD